MQRNPSQFSLRTLLAAVTAAAVVFAVAKCVGGPEAVLASLVAILLAIGGAVLYLFGARAFGASFAAAALVVLFAFLLSRALRDEVPLLSGIAVLSLAWFYFAMRGTEGRRLRAVGMGLLLGFLMTLFPLSYLAWRAAGQRTMEEQQTVADALIRDGMKRRARDGIRQIDRLLGESDRIAGKPITLDAAIRRGRWAYLGHGGSGLVIGERGTAFLRADHDKVAVDVQGGCTLFVQCVPKRCFFVTREGFTAVEGDLSGADIKSRLKEAKNLTIFEGDEKP